MKKTQTAILKFLFSFWNKLTALYEIYFQLYHNSIPFVFIFFYSLSRSCSLCFGNKTKKFLVFLFTCCFNTGRMANEKYIRYKVLVYFAALWIIIYLLLLSLLFIVVCYIHMLLLYMRILCVFFIWIYHFMGLAREKRLFLLLHVSNFVLSLPHYIYFFFSSNDCCYRVGIFLIIRIVFFNRFFSNLKLLPIEYTTKCIWFSFIHHSNHFHSENQSCPYNSNVSLSLLINVNLCGRVMHDMYFYL